MRTFFFAAVAVAIMASAAHATNLSALLDGLNEVPPVNTPATGTFTGVLNDVTNVLTYQIDYFNLSGPPTASHIHRAPAGVNGPVVYPLAGAGFPSGHQGQVNVNPADIPDLLAQRMYCNVHSQQFPGGEIRGQIVVTQTTVEPGTWGHIKDLFR
jgi:hypothetical protein